jgi:hypothetical protein
VLGELVEAPPQLGLGVDQRGVVQPRAVPVEGDGVMALLAHVETEKHLVVAVHRIASPRRRVPSRSPSPASTAGSHGTKRPTPTCGRPCPYQRPADATAKARPDDRRSLRRAVSTRRSTLRASDGPGYRGSFTMPITARLRSEIVERFPQDSDVVVELLQELDDKVFSGNASERVLAAVIFRSRGDLDRFLDSVRVAEEDWRDVLMQGGLAHDDWPSKLDELLGIRQERPGSSG